MDELDDGDERVRVGRVVHADDRGGGVVLPELDAALERARLDRLLLQTRELRVPHLDHGGGEAFPDLVMTPEFVIAEGDMVAARWTIRGTQHGQWAGVAASGRQIEFTGVNIFRIENDQITAIWNNPTNTAKYTIALTVWPL